MLHGSKRSLALGEKAAQVTTEIEIAVICALGHSGLPCCFEPIGAFCCPLGYLLLAHPMSRCQLMVQIKLKYVTWSCDGDKRW
jgi:hypothetical protein